MLTAKMARGLCLFVLAAACLTSCESRSNAAQDETSQDLDTQRGMRRHKTAPAAGLNGVLVAVEGTVLRNHAREGDRPVSLFESVYDYDTLSIGEKSRACIYNFKTGHVVTLDEKVRVQLYDDGIMPLEGEQQYQLIGSTECRFKSKPGLDPNRPVPVGEGTGGERGGGDCYFVSPVGLTPEGAVEIEIRSPDPDAVSFDIEIEAEGYKESVRVEAGKKLVLKKQPANGMFCMMRVTQIISKSGTEKLDPPVQESFLVVDRDKAKAVQERVAEMTRKAREETDATEMIKKYIEAARTAAPPGEKRWEGYVTLALNTIAELEKELIRRAGGKRAEICFHIQAPLAAYGVPTLTVAREVEKLIGEELDRTLSIIRDGQYGRARDQIQRLRNDVSRLQAIKSAEDTMRASTRRFESILLRFEGIILAGEGRWQECRARYEEAIQRLPGDDLSLVEKARTQMNWGVSGLRELQRFLVAAVHALPRGNDPLRESETAAKAARLAEEKIDAALATYDKFSQGREPLPSIKAMVDEGIVQCLLNRGFLHQNLASLYQIFEGQEDKARQENDKALAAFRECAPRLQKLDPALPFVSDLWISAKNGEGTAALRGGRLDEAARLFEEAIARLARNGRDAERVPTLIHIRNNLARVYLKSDPRRALEELRASLALIEKMLPEIELGIMGETRASFLADRSFVYDTAIRLAFEDKQGAFAFELIERSKGRALMDLWLKREKERTRIGTPPEYDTRLESIQKFLAERKTSILEYYVGSGYALVCLVTADGLSIESLKDDKGEVLTPGRIAPALSEYSELLAAFDGVYRGWHRKGTDKAAKEGLVSLAANLEQTNAVLRRLGDVLLAPVESKLSAGGTLCVVPHGILSTVPFHALPMKNGDPLLARQAVFYAYSAAALLQWGSKTAKTPSRPVADWNALVVAKRGFSEYGKGLDGNPTLPALKTIAEARKVAGTFARSTLLIDFEDDQGEKRTAEEAQPTEAAVKKALKERRDFVLLSTHACFKADRSTFADSDDPLDSFIVLGKGGGEDGLLTMEEIADLNLPGTVVFLSACQTGQAGGLVAGYSTYDEFVSLAAAFSLSGASAVVASMRPVWDDSAKRISVEFAKQLKEGLPRAEALRAAALKVRERSGEFWNHPAHWAAFYVVGDGG